MSFTRRDLLKLGGGAGLYLAIGPRGGPDPRRHRRPAPELLTRRIPSSGEEVPAVGIGTRDYRVAAGGDFAPYKETLETFYKLGGKLLDTAPSYGNAESVLGRLLAELGIGEEVFLATKVDRVGREAGIARMEASFEKLRTDHIDLMQVHNLRDTATQLESLRAWKEKGRVGYIGVTTSSRRQHGELERIMSREDLDFIQVDYSLGNRAAADRILPLAAGRGMAVLVNLPFGRGRLFRTVGDRELPEWSAEFGAETWGQFFLKYILSHPAITCVIPGTTKQHHAVDNLGAARGRLPDDALRRRMEELYDSLGEGV